MALVNHVTPTTADGIRLFYRADWNYEGGMVSGHYNRHIFIPHKNNSNKGMFRPMDPGNILSQIRLYRYFSNQPHTSGLVLKDDLMYELFKDAMHHDPIYTQEQTEHGRVTSLVSRNPVALPIIVEPINKHRVGRLLRMCVPYRVNFQRPALRSNNWTNQQFWRWAHPLDIAYGLEHLMTLWLPRLTIANDGKCSTDAEYNEELEILRQQTPAEDLDLIQSVIERKIY